jgi:hypothetical protein
LAFTRQHDLAADGGPDYPPSNPYWTGNQVTRVYMISSHTLDQVVGLLGGYSQATGDVQEDMFGRQVCFRDYIPWSNFLTLAYDHSARDRQDAVFPDEGKGGDMGYGC